VRTAAAAVVLPLVGLASVVVAPAAGAGSGGGAGAAVAVTAVVPDAGGPGTILTVTGTGFTSDSVVQVGTVLASSSCSSPTTCRVVVPVGAGLADVVVSNASGTSQTGLADQFQYGGPVLSSVSPNAGYVAGGTPVYLSGFGFTPDMEVAFGDAVASSVSCTGPSACTALAPPGQGGTVRVYVKTPGGDSSWEKPTAATRFTYTDLPVVSGLSVTAGAQGQIVSVEGSNFTSATAISFGPNASPSVTCQSAVLCSAVAPAGTGTVDVTATTAQGTSATSGADQFTYGGPMVTSVGPSAGPLVGGTSVTVYGSGFTGETAVSFGRLAATSVVCQSDTQCTAVAPTVVAGGAVHVTVTTPAGTSSTSPTDVFTYGPPVVTSVEPPEGTTAGGSVLVVTGSGLTADSSVQIGPLAATTVSCPLSTLCYVTAPQQPAGSVPVTVTTPAGTSTPTDSAAYTYDAVPAVSSVTPADGSPSGGETVTVQGSGFTAGSYVEFGSTASPSGSCSATSCTVTAPPGAVGAVDVTVTSPGGTSAPGPADQYDYDPVPVVTSVFPSAGPLAGGTFVTIQGTGFTSVSQIYFGPSPATSVQCGSTTSCTALSPAGPAGAVPVTVVTPGGTSSASAGASLFAYEPPPSISSISPAGGPLNAGDWIQVTGTGLAPTDRFTFGSVPALAIVCPSSTSCSVEAPPSAVPATVNVSAGGPGGLSRAAVSTQFTYYPAPTVSGLSARLGAVAGSTALTVTGTNLVAVTQISFGGVAARSVSCPASTHCTVLSPPHAAGTVDVQVHTLGGTSPAGTQDRFSYTQPSGRGYLLFGGDGGVFNFGDAPMRGSLGGSHLSSPIGAISATPTGAGYWLATADGQVYPFGDARPYGSLPSAPASPIVAMAATPTGNGYWLASADGHVYAFGDAVPHGSAAGYRLNRPIVTMAATPTGGGYWLVAADGGLFNFGDAGFYGSAGNLPLVKPIVTMAATPDGRGYWMIASDGGVFNYGDARFHGSAGNLPLVKPVVTMAATPDGGGYWLFASDGGVFNYGDARFYGSTGNLHLAAPIVGASL
jgi:hypothetical protein